MTGSRDAERAANLLGALALRVATQLVEATGGATTRPPSDTSALVTLALVVPGISQDTLARSVGLSQSGVTRLVDRLVADGLVTRGVGPDRRTVALTATAAGERAARRALAARRTVTTTALAGLTGPEQRQLTVLLERLLDGVTERPEDAYAICRLCDPTVCHDLGDCPVTAAARRLRSAAD